MDGSALASIVAFIGAFFVVFLIIGIIWYVFSALGIYTMAKNRNIENAWIAWIPICQYYLIGKLIGNRLWGFGFTDWCLVLGTLIPTLISSMYSNSVMPTWLATIVMVFSVVYYVYLQCAMYNLYKIYIPKRAVLYLVLSIIFPFLTAIFIFTIRKNKPQIIPQ